MALLENEATMTPLLLMTMQHPGKPGPMPSGFTPVVFEMGKLQDTLLVSILTFAACTVATVHVKADLQRPATLCSLKSA